MFNFTDMMDVRKQKDLSGFYRHLLNQTSGVTIKEEKEDDTKESKYDKFLRQTLKMQCPQILPKLQNLSTDCFYM